jgi:glutaredoxin
MDKTINIKTMQMIKKIIENKNIYIIFGITNCRYCKNAIEHMNKNSLPYKYYAMDKYCKIFITILNKISNEKPLLKINKNHDTFPVIFYNNKFIGGYRELIKQQ